MKREDFIKIVAKNTAGMKLQELLEVRSEMIECFSEDAEKLEEVFNTLETIMDNQADISKRIMLEMKFEE